MKIFAIFIILLITVDSPKKIDLECLCKDISNSYECAKKIEEYQLPRFSGLVKREDNKLIIKLDNSKNLILENIEDEGKDGIWYTFYDYLKIFNSTLIHTQFYEGYAYSLINMTNGYFIDLPGLIKISPDQTRIISYNRDIEACYSTNGFVIFKFTNNTFQKEFELYPEDWGPSDLKWINDKQIEINMTGWKDGKLKPLGKTIYELRNGEWTEKE